MKLEITKERILEAANKCSTAKGTLKTLFPEVFEDDKYLDFKDATIGTHNFDTNKLPKERGDMNQPIIQVRAYGNFRDKSFYLSGELDWQIIRDDEGELVLIPTKK